MKRIKNHLLALLTIAALLMGQTEVLATTWTVYCGGASNTQTFYATVLRDHKAYDETVYYRAVSLSAVEGQHFTAASGSLTIPKDYEGMGFEFTYCNPTDNSYKYQEGTSRSVRVEILDRAGFVLARCDCTRPSGYDISNYSTLETKDVPVQEAGYIQVSDAGYAQNYYPVPINNYFRDAAPQAYLLNIGAQLRMTVDFEAYERKDGYQYIQILVNETTYCDTGAGDGDPGTINLSHYMSGFEHNHGTTDGDFAYYSFPVTSVGENSSTVNKPWSDHGNTVGNMIKQKFRTNCRASDGRLIIPTDLTTLGIRFNASGSDNDDWTAHNTYAHIQAIDVTAPVQQGDIVLSPGRHAKGNVAYISVPFSEVVNVNAYNGNLKLLTTWGDFYYLTGAGSNVLTFRGTINANAGTVLRITEMNDENGSTASIFLTDIGGNRGYFGTSIAKTFTGVKVDADLTYTLDDFIRDSEGNYLISTVADLRGLASYVNAGNDCTGLTFRQTNNITGIGTTTPIGVTEDITFNGTYDGGGFVLSNLTINGNSMNSNNNYVGLFGATGANAVIKNVWLKDSTIKGNRYVGGIVGHNCGVIRNCLVESSVTVTYYSTTQETLYHGGIAGYNKDGSSIEGCRSAAKPTTSSKGGYGHGGIVGCFYESRITVKDCLYTGGTFGTNYANNSYGTITGDYPAPSIQVLFNNYYTTDNYKAVGWSENDVDGARKARTITLSNGLSIVGDVTTYDVSGITTYGDVAIAYNGNIYSGATQSITLSGASPTTDNGLLISGERYVVTYNDGTEDHTDYYIADSEGKATIIMPDANITVSTESVNIVTPVSYIDENGDEQTCSDFTVIESGNDSYVSLGNSANDEAWYVVPAGEVTISGSLYINDKAAHLILCDGAELTATNILCEFGSLTIYGQSQQSGELTANSQSAPGLYVQDGDLTVNGGNIITTSASDDGIRVYGANLIINRGNVTATSTSIDNGCGIGVYWNTLADDISTGGHFTINGGTVSATGWCGIWADGIITLGWTDPEDRIYASSYLSGSGIVVKDGQYFTDGNDIYTGDINVDDIADKTLQPCSQPINYIDENGDEQTCSDFTVIESSNDSYVILGSNTNDEAWYVVPAGEVTISGSLYINDKAAHLILCDGAELNTSNILCEFGSLTIYGQSQQSGKLTANSQSAPGLYVADGDLTVNGGNIIATSANRNGIDVYGANFIINRGNVTATSIDNGCGIGVYWNILADDYSTGGDFTINGGTVSATGNYGIRANGFITLGWTDPEDRIYASSYWTDNCVVVKEGQAFTTDGNDIYTGNIYDYDDIAGKTLSPTDCPLTYMARDLTPLDWNWVSFYVETDLDNLKAQLVEATGGNGPIIINSQTDGCTVYDGTSWKGALSSLDLSQMYQIKLWSDCELQIEGELIDPGNHPTVMSTGYNWIGFPSSKGMSFTEAFAGFAVNGDRIYDKYNNSTTYNGGRWRGSFYELSPGQGYIYKLNREAEFSFPPNSKGIKGSRSVFDSHWLDFNSHDYMLNQPVVASIQINNQTITSDDECWELLEVAAFVDGQCRGCAFLRYDIDEFGERNPVVELPVYYTEPNEVVTFTLFDHANGVEYEMGTLNNELTILTGEEHVEFYTSDDENEWLSLNFTGNTNVLELVDDDLEMPDGEKNADKIAAYIYQTTNVTLLGRTLYKDGAWNTLCLPFNVMLEGSPLEGAEVRTLNDASLSGGTLTLNFTEPFEPFEELVAGTPYIIKWDYDAWSDLVDPTFSDVTISDETHNFTSGDGTVQFLGTYTSFPFEDEDRSILFLGAENTLYYPMAGTNINAFRAYFKLLDSNGVNRFVLNFGEDDATGIEALPQRGSGEGASWYDLNGRKMVNGKLPKGIYIHGNRKIMIP